MGPVSSVLSSLSMRRLWLSAALLIVAPTTAAAEQLPVTADGGVYSVPVHINSVLRMDMVLDTGAAYVMIPADVALTLKRTGTLTTAQEREPQDFDLADGSVVKQRRVVLCSLQIGTQQLRDVEAVVGGLRSPLLLGQSALRRLEPWRLDTASGHLILLEGDGYASGRDAGETNNVCAADDLPG